MILGGIAGLLIAVIFTSGGYQIQGVMAMVAGFAITACYGIVAVLRLLPSLA